MEKVYHQYEAFDGFLDSKWNWIFCDIQDIHGVFLLNFRIESENELVQQNNVNHLLYQFWRFRNENVNLKFE